MQKQAAEFTKAEQKVLDHVAQKGSLEYCDGTGARYVTVANLVRKGLLTFQVDREVRAYGSSTWSGCVKAQTIRLWKVVPAEQSN